MMQLLQNKTVDSDRDTSIHSRVVVIDLEQLGVKEASHPACQLQLHSIRTRFELDSY